MASIFFPCQPCFSSRGSSLKKQKLHHHHYYCHAKTASSSSRNLEHNITSSFNFKNRVGVPLNELASFDQYMEDKGRVIRAVFPEKSTSQQVNELDAYLQPNITHQRFLDISRNFSRFLLCELEDLQADYMPLDLNINAKGALYLEREGMHNSKLNWSYGRMRKKKLADSH